MRKLLVAVCLSLPAWSFAVDAPGVRLEPFIDGVEFPTDVTHDGTTRLFALEQRGRIRLVAEGKLQAAPYLDIRDRVKFGGECGLLGLAFHPQFAKNGRFFLNYTTQQTNGLHTIIAEFHADPRGTSVDPATEKVVLKFKQPYANHNGGQILFGPDGKLYIGTGDGGSAGDPHNNGQRLDTLLGKILRIDVDGAPPYRSPRDNPFVGRAEARPEIWAFGLRNPWRFCFDRVTGLLYAADVGQNKWEEIDLIEKGRNYGWRIREGLHPFATDEAGADLVDPIKEYGHNAGVSITGGFVYRGKRIPALVGWYVYGDYGSGRIWGLHYENGRVTGDIELLKTQHKISSFGEDVGGELYVCSHYDNAVLRLVSAAIDSPAGSP